MTLYPREQRVTFILLRPGQPTNNSRVPWNSILQQRNVSERTIWKIYRSRKFAMFRHGPFGNFPEVVSTQCFGTDHLEIVQKS